MKRIFVALAFAFALLAPLRSDAQVAATYFAIDNNGALTVTSAGAAAINALTSDATYTLTVAATNAGGTGTGTITILAHAAPPPPPPAPVVTNGNFSLSAPVSDGQSVGSAQATGNPTSWAITGSSP